MDNKEYLEKVKKVDEDYDFDHDNLEYRKVKAMEIIAEGLILKNENSDFILTALENIETTLRR